MFGKQENDINVFVSDVSEEVQPMRKMLNKILVRAGVNLLYPNVAGIDMPKLKPEVLGNFNFADCSIHLLGHSYGNGSANGKSLSEEQFDIAKAKLKNNDFKIFVWYPENAINKTLDENQEIFINKVRNNISGNMVFSDNLSPIIFVEDVLSVMKNREQKTYEINATEIYFIYNQIDQEEADDITDLLSSIADIEKLNVVQNSDEDYSELVAAQMKESKLTVVYFKKTADWAVPFVQQIWKKIGGASSGNQILMIGDANTPENAEKTLSLPNVESRIISGELIPLEIKVLFDRINNDE